MFKITPTNKWPYWPAIILVFPALLINLGLLPFIDDEAIRALVAFEMKQSGNYIVPTLHATNYYSKPPLFNWILLVFFEVVGRWDEMVARLPTIFSVLGFAATIYYFVKKNINQKVAFISAFAFVTCGRVLFWDSFLALIDITYSWVTFTSFMLIYHYWKKERWTALFVSSYLLASIGFLLKGFPSVLFQGATLVAWFLYQKDWKRLLTWAHIKGVALFVLIVGGYYLVSSIYNESQMITSGLLEQASSRTVLERSWKETLVHFFSFPLEMSYHFLPWSLLFIYFFQKDFFQKLRANPFVFFLFLTFVVNIPVYWTSPRVYPRYVLMLFPLLFIIGIYLYDLKIDTKRRKIIEGGFGMLAVLFTLGSFAPLFADRNYELSNVLGKVGLIAGSLILMSYFYFKNTNGQRLVFFISILLITRIGFDWFVLPDRLVNDNGIKVKSTSIEAALSLQDTPLYVYKKTLMQPTNSYYLSITRGRIIPRLQDNFPEGANYIVEPSKYPDALKAYQDSMYMRHDADRYFHIGRLDSSRKRE